jgi:uncharacterized protein
MRTLLVLPLLFLLQLLNGYAQTLDQVVAIPRLAAFVTDTTGVLGAEQLALEKQLERLKAEKGSDVAVLILPSTKPETIEQYSIRVVEQWKLGRRGVDDGVLLLVALHDRRVRIEVGRGLEGDIPDLVARRIIEEQILPRFRQGDIVAGIQAGVACIDGKIRGVELPPPAAESKTDVGAVFPIFFFAYALGVAFAPIFGRAVGVFLSGGFGFAAALLVLPISVAAVVAVVSALFVLFSPVFAASHVGVGSRSGRSAGVNSGLGGWSGRGPFGGGSFGSGSFGGGGSFSGGGASGRW